MTRTYFREQQEPARCFWKQATARCWAVVISADKGYTLICLADPTYMIRAIPGNASYNVYCTLLAQITVHGAMAGYTGFTSGLVNGRQTYIPFSRINAKQNQVVITDRMWARVLSSTNQLRFIRPQNINEAIMR